MIKVSVIIPVYNVQAYLGKCLESLVGQTLAQIELIVVNDGSTDDSQKIIDAFRIQYPEIIKAYTKENGGLSDARNFGLEKASGQYIGFVDADDWVTPNMFEEMYDLAEKHHAQMVVCNLQKIDESGKVTQKLVQIPNMPERIVLKNHFSVFSDLSYFACNKLFNRELFGNHRFKKGVHFEDIQLIPQLLLNCEIVAQTQHYHYQYFERSDSITKTHTEKGLDILKAVEEVTEAFEKSRYRYQKIGMKNFQILEGVYTFLAYLARVKDPKIYAEMSLELKRKMEIWNVSKVNLLTYKRFGKNYILSLPLKKKIYYLLYFLGLEGIIRKLT